MSSNIFGFTQASFLANLPGGGGSSLAGYVTIATEQTITGQKTFDDDAIFNYDLYTQNLIASNFSCSSVTSSLDSPSTLTLTGASGVSIYAAGILGMTINTSGQTYCAKTLKVDSDFRLLDVFTPGSGKQSQMYHANTQLVLYNLENSGSIAIRNKNSTGALAQGILLSYTDCTITTSNCPQINGFTQPSTADSTDKIATTAWVQSVIGSGSGPANSVYMADNATNSYFPLCFSTGTPDGYKSVYQNYSGVQINPSIKDVSLTSINTIPIKFHDGSSIKIGAPSLYSYDFNSNQSTCIGSYAGEGRNAIGNVIIGYQSAYSLYNGDDNVILGRSAGYNITSGSSNILIGREAGGNTTLASNSIIIGNQVAGNNVDNEVIIGNSNQTQYIQTQINHRTQFIYGVNGGPLSFNLSTQTPEVVFIDVDTQYLQITIVLPNLASNIYVGATIMFRKVPHWNPNLVPPNYVGNNANVTITIAGGGQFVDFNSLSRISSFGFNTDYIYVDMVCNGTFWCINKLE